MQSLASGGAPALEKLKAVASDFPGLLQAVPGDPVIAKRIGLSGGFALLIAALLGPFSVGIFISEASAVGHVANVYSLFLALLSLLLDAEFEQAAAPRELVLSHVRCLGLPQGVGVIHLVQSSLAFAQGSAGHILAGIPALIAGVLQLVIWRLRTGALASNDNTGLIAGQLNPMQTEATSGLRDYVSEF
mmetsp:Transcript_46395/g.92044  ORF Transcript_46395/g.92044 Transcript_46395/m.92044 type:complete len:189 (+) Transcript_46395:59-625(+)